MAIFNLEVNKEYSELVCDVIKYVSILMTFYYISVIHCGKICLFDNKYFLDNILILILSLMFYHLVLIEVITVN